MKSPILLTVIASLVFGLSATASASDKEQACGKVSIFFNPPLANDIYPAIINKIDDDALKRNRHTYRLPVGKHTIKLHRNFDDPSITGRSLKIEKSKAIEIDVKPNTTYHLGAKFIRKNKHKKFHEKFWEPVVWKTTQRSCSL